ncbi:MAG: glycine--tRNA ligase [Patescibacteria group bacterium]|nr:glycine--tRNA ligase [Patescibacteria group bacterium]
MKDIMEKIVALSKRRAFIFPGSDLYGGLNGTWDLGPLGVLLANNIKNEWWKKMVILRDDVVPLDSSIISSAKIWEASSHITSFTDPLVECKNCHQRFRADLKKEMSQHEKEHEKPSWTEVKEFNLMFKTYVGPIEDQSGVTYLRPETAQGIFINFANITSSTRVKIPFGVAQIGKGFRNEITTGNLLFRVREFEMMELEYFVRPEDSERLFSYWREERLNWYLDLGIKKKNIKVVDLPKADIAHYSKGTSEIWYNWPFMGFGELEGLANRGDYDLAAHSKHSGRDLSYFDAETNKRFIPYVIEPSVGVGRAMLAFLIEAYSEEEKRVVLRLDPRLAPYKAAVFPLLANKENLVTVAKKIHSSLKKELMQPVDFDARGNIGKRYLSQDEIGTPYCITVDFQSLEDQTVTVRDRNTTKQERVKIDNLADFFRKILN